MKKILALAVVMLLIPFTAFGLETLSDSDMDSISGQSGVAIALDDVKVYSHETGTELWYQTNYGADALYNGTSGTVGVLYGGDNFASIGLVWGENSYQMLHVNALGSVNAGVTAANLYSPGRDLQGTYVTDFTYGNALGDSAFKSAPLTIHVSDDLQLFKELGQQAANGIAAISSVDPIAGVRIGLPTVELFTEAGSQDELSLLISINDNPISDRRGDDNVWSYGTLYMTDGDSTTAIIDGYLEITPLEAYADAPNL